MLQKQAEFGLYSERNEKSSNSPYNYLGVPGQSDGRSSHSGVSSWGIGDVVVMTVTTPQLRTPEGVGGWKRVENKDRDHFHCVP